MISSKFINALFLLQMLSALTAFSSQSHAAIDTFEFDNAQQEIKFHELTKLLRCPKCQNQNIADSNAELAKDLRHKTYQLVKQGKTKDEVVDYMVARFGNFVRYDPPITPATIFLWLGPLCFVLGGIWVLIRQIKKQSTESKPLDDIEAEKLQALLKQHAKDTES